MRTGRLQNEETLMFDETLPERVLDFWFGPLDADGLASDEVAARWWKRNDAFDARIVQEHATLHEAVRRGEHEAWRAQPRSLLAYVIVLDQFSRNMFRGDPRAFASDARALAAASLGVAQGLDAALLGEQRVFLYMPFEHSEELVQQERSVALFSAYRDATPPGRLHDKLAFYADFAVRHRDVVQQWGRFPHRNQVLGRPSSAAERAFLAQPNSSF